MAEGHRLLGITEDWSTAALVPGGWYSTVREGGSRFMAAWVKEEEKNTSEHRQKKKREAEEEVDWTRLRLNLG